MNVDFTLAAPIRRTGSIAFALPASWGFDGGSGLWPLEVVVDGDVNGPFARRARHRVLGGEKPAPLPPGRYGVGVETRLGFTSPPAIDVR